MSDFDVVVPSVLAVVAQAAQARCQSLVVGDDGPRFAKASQILSGIKAETADAAQRADAPLVAICAVRLRGIFDQQQIVAFGDLRQRIEIAGLAVEMNGKDRPRPGSDRPFDLFRVEIVCHGVDVDENGSCTDVADGPACADPSMRSCNNLCRRGECRTLPAPNAAPTCRC